MNRLFACMAMTAYIVVMVILIQWVTMSFVVTGNGPIKWEKGWQVVSCQWKECE